MDVVVEAKGTSENTGRHLELGKRPAILMFTQGTSGDAMVSRMSEF